MFWRLKSEIEIVGDQVDKHKQAKEALRTLNETYKKQIVLVKEESKLRLEVCFRQSNNISVSFVIKEEQSKRQESMGGYNNTMTELSTLLENHTGQDSK